MDSLFIKLTELLSEYKKVVLISHRDPDLDAIGSSMGLSAILNRVGKECYIFLSDKKLKSYNTSVKHALEKAEGINLLFPKEYKDIIDEETILVVLDVHQRERLEYPEILDDIKKVVVIDHHIKNNDYIKDTEMFYIDSTVSSVVEIITNYAKYCGVNLDSVIATIMLAGLEIDTNGFNLKTTAQTFEVAAVLTAMGADTVLKQRLLKGSKDNFLRRAAFIESSYIINKNIAICMLSATSSTKEELAEIAEELLKFEYVEASFAIGQLVDECVGVSARSIGNMNVCDVMKKMGGGGHITNAATQITDKTVMDVEKMLRKTLGEML